METIKHKGVEIHVGCEGTIIRGRCTRCGERKSSRLQKLLGSEPLISKAPKLDEAKYKQRIRNLEDLK